ncbi:VPLPA-CTERM sorting domain-containing protein [Sulfitobacter sp. F26169L]|uniref:VPLPA-CTERM sorting domain-containing protein n=1 Tax=Sulfitobacter sp. F26169L TaxID=2996015 RepID=UPI002260B470|nr:VPLPA-CTERM sorting domain-containing protein [Sulfitobacter sp. F26169L]MCX7565100.1 VPLPA-CTERM sorting domain-containing protein [Sulfitobacter sp. F26169L]
MLDLKKTIAAGLFACIAMTGAASATTIQIFNDTDITDPASTGVGGVEGALRGTVTCSEACSALYYTGNAFGFGDPGEMFDGPSNSGSASEAGWVNSVILSMTGTSPLFTGVDVEYGKQDNGDPFTTDALYAIMKIGNSPTYLMIRNDHTGEQEFSYAKATGAEGGLSHSVGLGTITQVCLPSPANNFCNSGPPVSVVPLPAGLPLLLGALGAFGIVSRRKSRKAT